MTALTIRIEAADDGRAAAAAAALASLPLSFTETDGDAAVVVISGAEGWAGRTRRAAETGARGVIVTDPVPDEEAAALLASPLASSIVLAEPWASSPACHAVVQNWSDSIARMALVDVRAVEPTTGRNLRTVLFAQLRLVQRLGVEPVALSIVAESATSILAVGRSATGARIVLSVGRSETSTGEAEVLFVGREEALALCLPDGRDARPGRSVLTSAGDAIGLPTTWQSAHRVSWIALHEIVLGAGESDDLRSFATSMALMSD